MTPEQYLINQLVPIITANNPQASTAAVTAYCTQLAYFYTQFILPNITADTSTGVITFNIPAGN